MKKNWIAALLTASIALFGAGCSADTTASKPAQTEKPADSTQVSGNTQETKEKPSQTSPKTAPAAPAAGVLKVYFFDVGQGDSTFIQTPKGENILIDGGNNDKGDDVVRYLNQLHVNELDDMIATHPDSDHIGGLDTVLNNVKVKNVYTPRVTHDTRTYEDFLLAVKNQGLKLKQAKAGVDLGLKGATMKLVAPVRNYGSEMNDWSAVAKLTYGKKGTFLFTGDAPFRSEDDMIASNQDISAQVLKVGHHGAKTATSQDFLNAVKPKYAVISVGQGNSYGHPTEEVLNLLKENDIKIFRTDESKTILATTDGNDIQFKPVSALTPNHSGSRTAAVTPPPVKKPAMPKTAVPPVTKQTQPKAGTLKAALDDKTPQQYHDVHLMVTGITGAKYTATFHYKSKDTVYEGTVGTPLEVRISRAAAGYEVNIDVEATSNGKTYTTQTSFIPQ
ncbi:ComEC/Rec2 family competence protein [Actinomycetes bacterium NPDC127524]